MARPQSNNADYYFHFNSMRNHRKIKMVRNKFGSVLGYAFWCMMLEWLIEHDGLEWENSEIEIEMFASELGVSAAEIPPMIDYCVKIGLLSKTDSDFIFSESLNENMQPLFDKRNRERERSKERKRKEDGRFLPINPTSEEVSAAEIPLSNSIDSNRVDNILSVVSQQQPEIFPKEEKTAEKSLKEKEADFLKMFNKITERSFRKLDDKAKANFKKILNDGYTGQEIRSAIKAAVPEMTSRGTIKYLTPEFITRPAEFSKYVNIAQIVEQDQKPKLRLQT